MLVLQARAQEGAMHLSQTATADERRVRLRHGRRRRRAIDGGRAAQQHRAQLLESGRAEGLALVNVSSDARQRRSCQAYTAGPRASAGSSGRNRGRRGEVARRRVGELGLLARSGHARLCAGLVVFRAARCRRCAAATNTGILPTCHRRPCRRRWALKRWRTWRRRARRRWALAHAVALALPDRTWRRPPASGWRPSFRPAWPAPWLQAGCP